MSWCLGRVAMCSVAILGISTRSTKIVEVLPTLLSRRAGQSIDNIATPETMAQAAAAAKSATSEVGNDSNRLNRPKHRADIDGLRAVACYQFVGFQGLAPIPLGGFVGVDIFFVISGYLIVTIILESLGSGRFNILSFMRGGSIGYFEHLRWCSVTSLGLGSSSCS